MSYIQKTITGDEKIINFFKIHLIFYILNILWIPTFIGLFFTEYGLTTKRVILKIGIISRNTDEMRLSKIETVEVRQGIFGRIFGFGTVLVTGTGNSSVVLKGVSNPISVKKEIDSHLD